MTTPYSGRRLYHFARSPFSRRARLALAHKGLAVELCEAREVPAHREEATRRYPARTIPVLVEPDGTVVGDSTAISRWIDAAYDGPPVWPTERAALATALRVTTLVDAALNPLVDLGLRYHALHHDPAWPAASGELLDRVRASLDALVALLPDGDAFTAAGWSAPEMWVVTLAAWLEGLPERAKIFAPAAQILSLGVACPAPIVAFAARHTARVEAL